MNRIIWFWIFGLLVSNVFVSLNVYVVRGLDGFMFHAETSSLHRSIGYIGYWIIRLCQGWNNLKS